MSNREQKRKEIRDKSTKRGERESERRKRMGKRFNTPTQQQTPTDTNTCKAETRDGTRCKNTATINGYCQKHAPNEYGELTWRYKRKQWHIHPDIKQELFQEQDLSNPSLYLELRMNLGGNISKKSFENTAAEFLLDNSQAFIDYATNKYQSQNK